MSDRRVGFGPDLGYIADLARPSETAGPQISGENAVTDSTKAPLPASLLEALARYDTPTICNALEIVAPVPSSRNGEPPTTNMSAPASARASA
jgi:hypothetical protein